MDGLFELLIILAIFLFPAVEAWARKRREAQRRREAGTGNARSGALSDARGRRSAGEERSAEVLLPEDLWEELTGERRDAGAVEEAPAGPGEPGAGERKPQEWKAEEWEAEEWEARTSPRREAEEWEAGERETGPTTGTGTGARTAEAESLETDLASREESPEGLGAEVGGFPEAEEAFPAAVPGEIGAGEGRRSRRSRTSQLRGIRPGRMARRGGEPAHARPAHPLVGELDRDALRRAVVYREILGPPVSLRDD